MPKCINYKDAIAKLYLTEILINKKTLIFEDTGFEFGYIAAFMEVLRKSENKENLDFISSIISDHVEYKQEIINKNISPN